MNCQQLLSGSSDMKVTCVFCDRGLLLSRHVWEWKLLLTDWHSRAELRAGTCQDPELCLSLCWFSLHRRLFHTLLTFRCVADSVFPARDPLTSRPLCYISTACCYTAKLHKLLPPDDGKPFQGHVNPQDINTVRVERSVSSSALDSKCHGLNKSACDSSSHQLIHSLFGAPANTSPLLTKLTASTLKVSQRTLCESRSWEPQEPWCSLW